MICYFLRLQTFLGKKVLITSFTNQAVNNIVERYLRLFSEDQQKVCRVASSKVGLSDIVQKVVTDAGDLNTYLKIEKFL